MARDDHLSLHQMLDYATEASMLVAEKEFTDLQYDRFIHGYDSVDLQVVWHVVTNDLPPLIEQLEDVLDAEG